MITFLIIPITFCHLTLTYDINDLKRLLLQLLLSVLHNTSEEDDFMKKTWYKRQEQTLRWNTKTNRLTLLFGRNTPEKKDQRVVCLYEHKKNELNICILKTQSNLRIKEQSDVFVQLICSHQIKRRISVLWGFRFVCVCEFLSLWGPISYLNHCSEDIWPVLTASKDRLKVQGRIRFGFSI